MSKFFNSGSSNINAGDSFFWGPSTPPGPPPFEPILIDLGSPLASIPNASSGSTLLRRKYDQYWYDDGLFFDTATLLETVADGSIIIDNIGDRYTMMWTGYFYAPQNGNYIFETTSDDSSMIWIGNHALGTDWLYTNPDVNNGGTHGSQTMSSLPYAYTMQTGYYPIRIVFGELDGGDIMSMNVYLNDMNTTISPSFKYNTATGNGYNA